MAADGAAQAGRGLSPVTEAVSGLLVLVRVSSLHMTAAHLGLYALQTVPPLPA